MPDRLNIHPHPLAIIPAEESTFQAFKAAGAIPKQARRNSYRIRWTGNGYGRTHAVLEELFWRRERGVTRLWMREIAGLIDA